MSQMYIMEPPTNGKIVLRTSAGDIDIELWVSYFYIYSSQLIFQPKEAPLATRNFVQLCMENYYDATIFHRLVPGFIVQGGDPTGTGMGGESIFGKPFKDEFHSRVRNYPKDYQNKLFRNNIIRLQSYYVTIFLRKSFIT